MPLINKITIEGFKSIRSAELELRQVNVLIGANGSGKSNLLQAFAFLKAIRAGQLQDYVAQNGGPDRILHFGPKATGSLKFHVEFSNPAHHYKIALRPTPDGRLRPESESLSPHNNQPAPETPPEHPLSGHRGEAAISRPTADQPAQQYIARQMDDWRIYHFHDTGPTSPLRKTADLQDNRYLQPDGSNLAAYLYHIRQKHPTQYQIICRTIQQPMPFFDDFLLEPSPANPNKIRLQWRHKGAQAPYDAADFSGGALRFIALTTLLYQPESLLPPLILLDEPELALHPVSITLLEALTGIAAVNAQIILTTQSPTLLDHFIPEEVLVTDRQNGATKFTRLTPEPLEVWLERYSLGELWEKNEFGGRPAGTYHERKADD